MKGSDNVFPKVLLTAGTAASTPAAGEFALYGKSTGGLFYKDSSGTEHPVGSGGGSGSLPFKNFVTDYGADPTGATDCGSSWDAAMADAIANEGLALYCEGHFLVSRALQNTSAENAQLPLPSALYVGDTPITVYIFGPQAPNPTISVIGAQPLDGSGITVFESTLSSGTGNMMAAYHAGSFRNFSNIHLVLRDLIFQMPANPTNSAVNLETVSTCDVDRIFAIAGSDLSIASTTYPTTATSYGFKTPYNGNGANTMLGTIDVMGFYNAYSFSEHSNGLNLKAWGCVDPFVFTNADHASCFQRLMAVHCTNGIVGPASGNAHVTRIMEYDIEHAASGAFAPVSDIDDADDTIYGDLMWRVVLAGTGGDYTFNVTGGRNLRNEPIGGFPYVRVDSNSSITAQYKDSKRIVESTGASPVTFTIPADDAVPWQDDAVLTVAVSGNTVTFAGGPISGGGTVTVGGGYTNASAITGGTLQAYRLGPNRWRLTGDFA